jgi:hypothetical protein
VNLNAIVQHVEADAEQEKYVGFDVPGHVEGNQDKGDAGAKRAHKHHVPLGHVFDEKRQRQRKQDAAEPEGRDDDASIG